jgi:predicted ATPase/DNA-binding XRE family transcriptional regulator
MSTERGTFGELLRRFRMGGGLTQEALAEKAGLSARGISDLERGSRRAPHPDTVRRLAEALGLEREDHSLLAESAVADTQAAPHTDEPDEVPRVSNLPRPLTPLIGREEVLARVRQILEQDDVRLLTLVGPAGTGKTRLAIATAAACVEAFANGTVLVQLGPVTGPDSVPVAIARAVGIRQNANRSLIDSLSDYVERKHLLLVLDNFEHVLPATGVVSALLAASYGLKVLVTSRTVLHLYGEHDYTVPPLELPPLDAPLDLQQLTQYEAVRLFCDRARAVEPGFILTRESVLAVVEVCRRLDGLPLAIELAAARTRLLPPEALVDHLERRLPLLVAGPRNLPERHQTLRSAIGWSFDLLNAGQQVLFRRLGVFAGGCTLKAAEEVCAGDTEKKSLNLLENMAALIDSSLVLQAGIVGGEPRFRMLETIREFAVEQLAASDEENERYGAYAAYYMSLVEAVEREQMGPRQRLLWDRLDDEHDNISSVLRWSLAAGEVALALRLVAGLCVYWQLRGHISEGRDWAERVLAFPGEVPTTVARARALITAGHLARSQGDFAHARLHLSAAIDIADALAQPAYAAQGWQGLAQMSMYGGDFVTAHDEAGRCLALAIESGDRWGEAMALDTLGQLAGMQRDSARGRTLMEQALAILRELGSPWGQAHALWGLGNIATAQGDFATAYSAYQESLAIERTSGRAQGAAQGQTALAWVALEQGLADDAEQLFIEGLTYWCHIGRKPRIAETFEGLAVVATARALFTAALHMVGAADGLWERMGQRSAFIDRARVDHWLEPARHELGLTVSQREWEVGHTMELAEAVAYANGQFLRGVPDPVQT